MGVVVHEHTSHSPNIFTQDESPEIVCIPKVTLFGLFDTGFSFRDPKIVQSKSFEMKRARPTWGRRDFLCWMGAVRNPEVIIV